MAWLARSSAADNTQTLDYSDEVGRRRMLALCRMPDAR